MAGSCLLSSKDNMTNSTSYYDILGISKKSSDDDIKRAYLSLAKKHHPDQNLQNRTTAAHNFQKILEAYDTLKTREGRARYNKTLRIAAENDNKQTTTGLFSNFSEWFRPKQKETQI